jgi:hypothetical protein
VLAVAGESIPYKATNTGEEKDFELHVKGVSLICAMLEESVEHQDRNFHSCNTATTF